MMTEYWMVRVYDGYAIDEKPTVYTYMLGLEKAMAKSIARHLNKTSGCMVVYYAEEEPRRWV